MFWKKSKACILRCIRWVFSLLPKGTSDFVYLVLFKPKPLRFLLDRILLYLLPPGITLPEGTLHFQANDPVLPAALLFGVYEASETKIMRSMIRPGMTVVDIGANIGYYTLIASRRVGNEGQILAFEPEPKTYEVLKTNIHANNIVNTQCFPLAISSHAGEERLFLSSENKMKHSLLSQDTQTDFIKVTTCTLDDFMEKRSISKVDFIKMDIEGAEGLALSGLIGTLQKLGPTIMTEYAPERLQRLGQDPVEFIQMLQRIGYCVFEISQKDERLLLICDVEDFIKNRFNYKIYTNLLCSKYLHQDILIRDLSLS